MSGIAERRKNVLTSMMKEAIYEAAVAVLSEHGLNGVTMERVAEQAGIAKGSIYNYFQNKLALIQFVHEKAIEPMVQQAEQIISSDMSAVEKLRATFHIFFDSINRQQSLFSLLFVDLTVRELLKCEEESGRAYAVQHIAAIVDEGIQKGTFRPVDSQKTARYFFGILRETCEQQLVEDANDPVESLVEGILDLIIHGLENTNSRLIDGS